VVVVALRLAGFHRKRRVDLFDQLARHLIHADHGSFRVTWPFEAVEVRVLSRAPLNPASAPTDGD
jgi:hypothetical protein